MTRLIFIRHGESLGNAQRRFLGHTDWDLTERGYHQAQKTAEYLKNTHIDVVYSSDLMRAYNTVLPIAKARGIEIIKDEAFREISAGKWEGLGYDEIEQVYPEAHKTWVCDIGNAVCTGGESVLELQTRVRAEIERVARENEGKTVCIGTHATPLRAMICFWRGLPIGETKNVDWVTNASVTVVDYEDGRATLVSVGEASHLGDDRSDELKNI